jgi:glutamate transport system permease protein
MSAPETVLYDAPGPRARRRAMIGAVIATVAIVAMLGFAAKRLADAGQFSMELWGPLINPADDNFGAVWQLLFRGLQATLTAAVLAIIFSLIIGTLIGVARMMLGRWTRTPLIGVIEILRGLPVVITIYFASRVLPEVGVNVSPLPGDDRLWYLVIGLTAYNCVIIAEIVRAGVASLPSGQGEAARAIGMTEWQVMRTVLLPQAFRTMLPALISQLVVILKDTSLAAVLGGYIELLRRGNIISQNLDNPIQTLFVVGLIFIALNYGLSRLAVWTERYAAGRGRGDAMKAPGRTGTEVEPKT